jgi:hypothetical protein
MVELNYGTLIKRIRLRCDHYYEQIPADYAEYSPDGKWIVAVVDTFFTVYDAELKPIAEGTGKYGLVIAKFSPDSKKIAIWLQQEEVMKESAIF